MRKISALVSAAALAAVSSVAFAAGPAGFGGGQAASGQAGGPAGFGPATALNTVQAVTQSGLDEQRVVLTGKLTNYLGNDKYEFADSTGRIVVELDDDRNWSHIGKDQTITIYGETDVTPRAIEIDVTDAQVVK
ncbi:MULTISPECIES: NirD/YgiW/YdeI family stress tolerance protein [unclassified Anaerobiospirillum]|uniref:NirD/YgiW/YdeI family stress tolerance protein n=1 Tax=unclassified Anaerobiospirillum TaxID=2647410 RepID=UPI001FF30BE5|nr:MULTISPECIES: NirD/YgiW/YdeI family stress tolerance protein [unclassified Anaerobiospirillum]MCK0526809.1 NirD/YgiW/YdeI family stress tolerance protein [Anaerobiospirillum sp. NML120449]MCK0534982.1 NirD/YgiW/YdeI family stress tolerance protein [Anaerobiospirillum sp. NML120511]MCK0540204.1 NirD/YgiW/YdeI family stress tolerance protein [Anaerobiospirillum sp. NML02-A-032]